jgi:hypothetical protein
MVVHAEDIWFQLAPDVMVKRFYKMLKKNNERLIRKYGTAMMKNPEKDGDMEELQKYSQRIIFGADKLCWPNRASDPACVAVPKSTLPPDTYGAHTDTYPDGYMNRPRWLNSGAVIGPVADMRLLYERASEMIDTKSGAMGDQFIMGELYGEQEYVRELERRRTATGWRNWFSDMLGTSGASNITGINMKLVPGRRYDYGIGVDFESQLFFSMTRAYNELVWLRYDNVSKLNFVQQENAIPRPHRLNLPLDLRDIKNPFIPPNRNEIINAKPAYNASIDYLPNPNNRSWFNIPLATNIHTTAVPAVLHMNGDRSSAKSHWSEMWYHPWARALLRKFMRSPRGPVAVQASLLGGDESWDMRGGKGGVWTDNHEWLEWAELCRGYESDVFGDWWGLWGQEEGSSEDQPIYNQFGKLVLGKGKEKELDEQA